CEANVIQHCGLATTRRELDLEPGNLEYGSAAHQRSLSLGLSASLSPSPIRLTDSTVTNIAIPGKVTGHHASRIWSRLEPIMSPQLMAFGSPRPRESRPAANKIATPTVSVADTINGGSALGRITAQRMRWLPAPMARSAVTNSSRFILRNSPRVKRATPVQLTTPIASATVAKDGENSV